MTETARQIFDEYRDMSDGDLEAALWWASMEIASLGRSTSAGYVRAGRGKPVVVKPRRPVIDDEWIKTGRDREAL